MEFPNPIFILASPRSFTSLICAMLGQHPEAYGVPELNLFVASTLEEMAQRLTGKYQFQLHGLIRLIAHLYSGEQTLNSIEMAKRWLDRHWDCSLSKIYYKLCHRIAPLRIIDKSPAYSTNFEYLRSIDKTFPNAFYLYLVRHPRTQGLSMMKIGEGMLVKGSLSYDYSTQPPTLDPQYAWYKTQTTILSFLQTVHQKKQLFMRGEDILNDPRSSFQQICQSFGLSWSKSAFQSMLNPQNSPFSSLGPYGATLGNDPNFLKNPYFKQRTISPSNLEKPLEWRQDGKRFLPKVIDLARQLGYH